MKDYFGIIEFSEFREQFSESTEFYKVDIREK
jgi:hypothetical protein